MADMTESKISSQKAGQRVRALRARDALPAARRADFDLAIQTRLWTLPEMQHGGTCFCFISHGSEVHTHSVLDELVRRGFKVLVPRIDGRTRMLAVEFSGWDELQRGQLGIPTPAGSREHAGAVDVCITPGLAFAEGGERLGFGRGYYDAWFAGHAVTHRIAPAYECQLLNSVAVGTQDVPVDIIVTEKRIIRTNAR